jgi:hypothetical protein
MAGVQGHMVSFEHERMPGTGAIGSLTGLPPGTIVAAMSMALLSPPQASTAPNLDGMLRGGLAGAAGQAGGAQILPDYDLVPSVGEDSRAGALRARDGDVAYAASMIVFRRQDVHSAIYVAALGDTPPVDEAIRLAQGVDAHLTHPALATGDSSGRTRPPLAATDPDLPPAVATRLAAALLVEDDLPPDMWPVRARGGLMAFLDVPGYMMSFTGRAAEEARSVVGSLIQPEGTMVMALQFVALVGEDRPTDSLDSAVERAEQMLSTMVQAPGVPVTISPVVRFPNPPVGEDSRAFALRMTTAGTPTTLAYVAFDRGGVVLIIGAVLHGDDPPLDALLQMAEKVDARLGAMASSP